MLFLRAEPSEYSGRLTEWQDGGSERTLATHVAPLEFPAKFGSTTTLVYANSLVEPYGIIQLLDLASGASTELTQGNYPQLGPDSQVSYCDRQFVIHVRTLGNPNSDAIASPRAANCGAVGWSADGKLAILTADGARDALYIRPAMSQQFARLDLSESLVGGGALSWSSDSKRIAFRPRRGVTVVDATSGVVQSIDFDGNPQFAPTEPDLLAALDVAHDTPVLAVFRAGVKIADRSYHDAQPASFAWSPDGEWIVTTADQQVAIWNWRTNESRVIATSEPEGIMPGIVWMP